MLKAARRRKASPTLRLIRLYERLWQESVLPARREPPTGKFVQCWAVHGRPVTQALDDQGQVWERVYRKPTETTPAESWWEPLGLERRDKPKEPHT